MSFRPTDMIPSAQPTLSAIAGSPSKEKRQHLSDLLDKAGMTVVTTEGLEHVLELIRAKCPSVAILQGYEVDSALLSFCRAVSDSPTRTIIMAPSSDLIDRVIALELGADEYLCEPVDDRLLMARLKAVMRRPNDASPHIGRDVPSKWSIDTLSRTATSPAGRSVRLTATELSLYELFLQYRGRLIDENFVHERLGVPVGTAFRTTISRLRRKLGDICAGENPIKNVQGIGYVFDG